MKYKQWDKMTLDMQRCKVIEEYEEFVNENTQHGIIMEAIDLETACKGMVYVACKEFGFSENEMRAEHYKKDAIRGYIASEPELSKYHRHFDNGWHDVYSICRKFGITDPAHAHAIKKLLMPGSRGAKSKIQDLKECIASIERYIEFLEEIDRMLGSTDEKE